MIRIIFCVLFILLISGSVTISFLTGRNTQPYLHLTKTEICIPQGGTFEPMEYVADYSSSKGELILPSDLNTASPGMKAAVYVLRTPETEITRILYVEVIRKEK